ncbi:MAG: MFS transporter [Muribaculaceae bacterium]|nr:MFS transporter [Muribaculaceae bacterium]
MKRGLFALSLGTFGLGITEYVMMSILPDLANGLGVSITQAGHLISSYALGVCAGAPLFAVLMRNMPLKKGLLLLMVLYVIGNLAFALSPGYYFALASRFVAGLPHGAYFGTGALVASRIVSKDKATSAVAMMVMGMTVANLVGIPAGSIIGNMLNWRYIFLFTTLWGIVTFYMLHRLVPDIGSLPKSNIKSQFRFLKSILPWLLIFTTMLCNGGIFCMYSYVSPLMSEAGMNVVYMPGLMVLVGGGMCLGNYLGGVMGDRYTPPRTVQYIAITMVIALVSIFFVASNEYLTAMAVVLSATCLFAVSPAMQLLLIEYSPGGELMGGAMVQMAFRAGSTINVKRRAAYHGVVLGLSRRSSAFAL